MSDAELLEILLFYAIPRVDTRKIAESLIEKYSSLSGVLHADINELKKIQGIKENAEAMFSLLNELIARVSVTDTIVDMLDPENLKRYLIEQYRNVNSEIVLVLYFGESGQLIEKQVAFRGGINSVKFSLRTVTEGAIRVGGKAVVLAHNHPSGSLIPSQDDIISTNRIAAHLAANDIELIEHYIVGKNDCVGIMKMK